jgi:hypothetical protein
MESACETIKVLTDRAVEETLLNASRILVNMIIS